MNTPVSPSAPDVDLELDVDEDIAADLAPLLVGSAGAARHVLRVPFAERGTRLDAWLGASALGLSRSRVHALIAAGAVDVSGAPPPLKPSMKLKGDEDITVAVPPAAVSTLIPEDIPLAVVFEDEHLLVIDKPAGLVVHPGAGHDRGTVANAVLFRAQAQGQQLQIGGVERPGIVHRLDKDTSGLMVIAKNDAAHTALSAAFRLRSVTKRYRALCLGRPREDAFDLVTGHRRADADRRRFTTKIAAPMDTDEGGHKGGVRVAHSRFLVRAASAGVSVVDVELLTGRTHQIRAHLADIGHPLLQDELYGGGNVVTRLKHGPVRDAVMLLTRQALHARALSFDHPITGVRLSFRAPLPLDLSRVVDAVSEGGVTDDDGPGSGAAA